MIAFVLVFVIFYAIVLLEYDKYIGPTLRQISTNKVTLPTQLIEAWLLVTASLFPLNSVIKARKSGFDLRQSLSFIALILGIILGMIVDV